MLIAVTNFSQTAVWVFGILFVVEFVALCVYVYRSGNADEQEGHVVIDDAAIPGIDRVIGGDVLVGRKYRSKKKVFASRSAYVSDMALVDDLQQNASVSVYMTSSLRFSFFGSRQPVADSRSSTRTRRLRCRPYS